MALALVTALATALATMSLATTTSLALATMSTALASISSTSGQLGTRITAHGSHSDRCANCWGSDL